MDLVLFLSVKHLFSLTACVRFHICLVMLNADRIYQSGIYVLALISYARLICSESYLDIEHFLLL